MEAKAYAIKRGAYIRGIRARNERAVVGDAATLTGTVEVMDLQAAAVIDFSFQLQMKRRTRRHGQVNGRILQKACETPGTPHGWHSRKEKRLPASKGGSHGFRQRIGHMPERFSHQEERKDQV